MRPTQIFDGKSRRFGRPFVERFPITRREFVADLFERLD